MLCYSVVSSHKNKFSILKSNHLYYLVEKFHVCTVSMLSSNTVHFFHSHWGSLSSSAFPKHGRKLHSPIFINSLPSKKKVVLNVVPIKGTRICTEILAALICFSCLSCPSPLACCNFSFPYLLHRLPNIASSAWATLLGGKMKRKNRDNIKLPLWEIFEVDSRLLNDRKNLTLYRQQISRELQIILQFNKIFHYRVSIH